MFELERIAGTFHRSEKSEFLSYIWSTTFVEWDRNATTEEAVKRANEAEERAERAWKNIH